MSGAGPAVEAAPAPRFTVRVTKGRATLVLAQPLTLAGGRLESLEIDVGPIGRAIDLGRGWRALRHRRGVALAATVAIDAPSLFARVPGLVVAGATDRGLLLSLERAWGHVAFEVELFGRGTDLLLVPRRARAAVEGPRTPTAEALSIAGELGASFDATRGALVLDDPMRDLVTDALVPSGMRVPQLDRSRRDPPRLRGAEMLLSLGSGAEHGSLETALVLAPALAHLAEGALEAARAALAGRRSPDVELLEDELAVALGDGARPLPIDLDAPRAALALRRALERGDGDEAARAARALDGHERAKGVAVDGLLAAAELLRGRDPATCAELFTRAVVRAPDDPRVLAAGAPLPAEPVARPLLRALEKAASLRTHDVAAEQAAIGRLHAHLGDRREATRALERAVKAAPGQAGFVEALAEAYEASGNVELAARTWAEARGLFDRRGRPTRSARASLALARLELGRERPREALVAARMAATSALGALSLDAQALLFEIAVRLGDDDTMVEAERALVALADGATPGARAATATALVAALHARPSTPLLEALGRLDRAHPAIADARAALERTVLAPVETAPLSELAALVHRLGERLVGEGRLATAARAFVRAGERSRDTALLRAAVDLAERAGDRALVLDVIDRSLAVIGSGPAREALERRRPR